MTTRIRPLVAGNWKMNGLAAALSEAAAVRDALPGLGAAAPEVMICPPATLIAPLADVAKGSALAVGAQDCHAAPSGAHTGDISAEMVKDAGATAVIVGHSERRADHGEDDALVNAKARAAWRAKLAAIICIGETEAERRAGKTLDVLSAQLDGSVPKEAMPAGCVIAYEPVWAIGTGLTPSVRDVAEAHAHIRKRLERIVGADAASGIRLLYGGSVKPANARELMAVPNVNGALVGGASLKAADFDGIIDAYRG